MKLKLLFISMILPFLLGSCTYLKYVHIQAEYSRIQHAEPGQLNLKHMIDRETFFVFGQTLDALHRTSDLPKLIAAYSDKFKKNELVDRMYFEQTGTHYGLNLPEGEYTLLVFVDQNRNQFFEQSEVIGQKEIALNHKTSPEKVMGHVDIKLWPAQPVDWTIAIPTSKFDRGKTQHSLFYPAGAIRSLDDPLFNQNIAMLGMYDPASFMERTPTMFYALEEDLGYKIPVVFVHGIGGTARSFKPIVKRLDRNRYKPWFFYYPSGGDLDQLSELFYRLFLSGKVIPLGPMPMIIVAHSMGGLVVREAINKYQGQVDENKVKLFFTIASPMGGHDAAASGEKHGLMVLPAWRDLNPNNRFIKDLYRKPLPEFVNHQLIYVQQRADNQDIELSSDGVVSLSSQLYPEVQLQSDEQIGFYDSHAGVLENKRMIEYILQKMNRVKNAHPQAHLEILQQGGFNVPLSDAYSPLSRYFIRSIGKYLVALATGKIEPISLSQEHFIQVVKGQKEATNKEEEGLLKFINEFPKEVEDSLSR